MSNQLAPYAVSEENSKGRKHKTQESFDRSAFERDKTRITHSSAFRRLQYKTQVFENKEGDNFRTRLTHSLEVAQVARAVAKMLNLNQDLAETLALAHDLGHAPFGHRGQDVLNELMKNNGGFEHNFQTLRIGFELESPYMEHEGLNLMYETFEGMLKHCSARRAKELVASGDEFLESLGQRFLDGKSPSLEAQVVDWSDAIAYLHADMEDAINMGILDPSDISKLSPKFAKFWAKAQLKNPLADDKDPKVIHEAIRQMMSHSIQDLVENSRKLIEERGVQTLEDVRNAPSLIKFSPSEEREHLSLKKMSKALIYDHPTVESQRDGQGDLIEELFNFYKQHPEQMKEFDPRVKKERQICDTIASLTDRGVLRELDRIKALQQTNTSVRKNKP